MQINEETTECSPDFFGGNITFQTETKLKSSDNYILESPA